MNLSNIYETCTDNAFTHSCDRLSQNTNITNISNVVHSMNKKNNNVIEVSKGGMKVILQFSEEPENRDLIEKEVKDILNNALQEQLQKIS